MVSGSKTKTGYLAKREGKGGMGSLPRIPIFEQGAHFFDVTFER